jgi:ABC-2 type transport system permease protein
VIWTIFDLTVRQVLSRRSTLMLLGFCLLPVLVALIYQVANNEDSDPERFAARTLLNGLVIIAILPLTALFLGTSVIGNELEDGTVVYLMTKPVERWQILTAKVGVSVLYTGAFVLGTTVLSGFLALGGANGSIVLGFGIAVLVGAIAYSTVFVLLSIVTSRALIAGMVYVFLWEGAVTSIFDGLRVISIRHYCLGIANAIADTPPRTFDATLAGPTAIILAVIATGAAFLYANHRLKQLEVREQA